MGWVQGTIWPFTNLDVSIMKKFQRNPVLSEQEIKVRIYAMAVMGSIYGDGSDYRDSLAASRAEKFMNNRRLMSLFSHPKAFIPQRAADGATLDQQLSFYLPGDTVKAAIFNFDLKERFSTGFTRQTLGLKPNESFEIRDILSGTLVGVLKRNENIIHLTLSPADALMVNIIPLPINHD